MSEEWTKEKLMAEKAEATAKNDAKYDLFVWGLPGHLTEEECEVYFKFRNEIEQRGAEFKSTVYSFGEIEGEAYTLCRWLRARKFVYDDVIKMVEEATAVRASAREADFYPVPREALGCAVATYFNQYPQLYTGKAKNGAPIFISKPGVLNVDAVECLTTIEGIVKFHWYIMMHDFGSLLRKYKAENPDFKRFECFCILDLDHLTTSQLSSRALAIVKDQSAIDSVCFPETMSKMVLVNCPMFFSATWRLIKGWLDPRTASKIDVLSNRQKGIEKLLEYIDADQLPSDYGGTATDTKEILRGNIVGDAVRIHTEMMYLRGHGSVVFEVKEGEFVEITAHTRSTVGCKMTITDADKKNAFVENVVIKHTGTEDANEIPSEIVVNKERIAGPLTIKVKADSNAGRFTTVNFLCVASFFPSK